MGIETAILVGLTAMSVKTGMDNAKSQAKATIAEGAAAAEERGKKAQMLAGQQKTSFLASGLSMEGTPLAVLNATYDTASADVANIISNANRSSKNIMGAARAKAWGQIAGMGASMYGGFGVENMSGQGSGFSMGDVPGTKPTRSVF